MLKESFTLWRLSI